MDALERCARMVRDAEDSNGNLPASHWVDEAEWDEIAHVIILEKKVPPGKVLGNLEVMGVPVRKFEIVGLHWPPQKPWVFG